MGGDLFLGEHMGSLSHPSALPSESFHFGFPSQGPKILRNSCRRGPIGPL